MNTFETFNNGKLVLTDCERKFDEVAWSKHPTFQGVELKHIVTGAQTGGAFSYHLVRIAPGCKIEDHIHATQLETHEVSAGKDGLYLFAKFIPALC